MRHTTLARHTAPGGAAASTWTAGKNNPRGLTDIQAAA
jgi:hypothetical protein